MTKIIKFVRLIAICVLSIVFMSTTCEDEFSYYKVYNDTDDSIFIYETTIDTTSGESLNGSDDDEMFEIIEIPAHDFVQYRILNGQYSFDDMVYERLFVLDRRTYECHSVEDIFNKRISDYSYLFSWSQIRRMGYEIHHTGVK